MILFMNLRAASITTLGVVALSLQPPPPPNNNAFRGRRDENEPRFPRSPLLYVLPVTAVAAPLTLSKQRAWLDSLLQKSRKTDGHPHALHDASLGMDFSGRWRLERSENFDEYLASMNVSATHRRFATRATVEHLITRRPYQNGGDDVLAEFEVCVLNRLGEKCEKFVVGSEPILTSDARGDPVTKHVAWEDHTKTVLVTQVTSAVGDLVDKRRLASDNQMIMELISPTRVRALRIFSRVASSPRGPGGGPQEA